MAFNGDWSRDYLDALRKKNNLVQEKNNLAKQLEDINKAERKGLVGSNESGSLKNIKSRKKSKHLSKEEIEVRMKELSVEIDKLGKEVERKRKKLEEDDKNNLQNPHAPSSPSFILPRNKNGK